MKKIPILTILVMVLTVMVLTACSWTNPKVPSAALPTQPAEQRTAPTTMLVPRETPTPMLEQSAAPAATLACPTTAKAKALTGVDVQRLATEPCAFVWRSASAATVTATCPTEWVCTWDVINDIVVVHLGVNQRATIRAGTWRYIAAYPQGDAVHDVCALYQKERDFGLSEIPSFQVRFQPVTDGTRGPVGPQSCP